VKGRGWRVALLVVLCAVAAVFALRAVRDVRGRLAALETCEAATQGDWDRTLETSAELDVGDEDGRAAAECRCMALVARDRAAECITLLDEALTHPDVGDWLPGPDLVVLVIGTWRDRGRTAAAADLARRASQAYPAEGLLLFFELTLRSQLEDEDAVLADMEARLVPGYPNEFGLRTLLAHTWLHRSNPDAALRVLGEDGPSVDDVSRNSWYHARAEAFAYRGEMDALLRNQREWEAAGGEPALVLARYAVLMSQAELEHPEHTYVEYLAMALEREDEIGDAMLHELVYKRLVGHLMVLGWHDYALVAFEKGRERFPMHGFSREEILRLGRAPSAPGETARTGTLVFSVPSHEDGGRLVVSPDATDPLDTPFEAVPLSRDGGAAVERSVSELPQRWVYLDGADRARASGTVWVMGDAETRIEVEAGIPAHATSFTPPVLSAGDGRQRVFVVILDCADWRLAEYLMARNEMQVLASLLDRGHVAVLDTYPAYTATSMNFLVYPGARDDATVLGTFVGIGVDLKAFMGTNPFDPLAVLLPETGDLFTTIGAADRVAANLLFSVGAVDAGIQGAVHGPHGQTQPPLSVDALRPFRDDELAAVPGLTEDRDPSRHDWIQSSAAMMDVADQVVRDGQVDLLLARAARLDTVTHAHYFEVSGHGQDDARGVLLDYYRFLDHRIGQFWASLDADDVLVVMSDHGILNSMQHARPAIFVAVGPDIPPGRTPGTPHLRGCPRVFADLLGVETDWPDTGIATWLSNP